MRWVMFRLASAISCQRRQGMSRFWGRAWVCRVRAVEGQMWSRMAGFEVAMLTQWMSLLRWQWQVQVRFTCMVLSNQLNWPYKIILHAGYYRRSKTSLSQRSSLYESVWLYLVQQNYLMFGSILNLRQTRSTRYYSNDKHALQTNPEQLSLKRRVNHIARLNLKDQDIDICACEDCIYSRQLNRKRLVHLQLSKNSSYRKQYQNKSLPGGNSPLFSIDYDGIQRQKHQKGKVVNRSSYLSNYTDHLCSKPERMRPNDELQFKGPVKGYSAYKQYFPAFKNNANPYVKPVSVLVPNTIKMNTSSIYQSEFSGQGGRPTESGKVADHLHGGLPWTGGSTYRQLFTIPRKEEGREIVSRQGSESLGKDSNYKHQYETIYRNHYQEGKKKCSRGSGGEINPLLQSLQL